MSDGGKGSAPRPITNWKTFEENWNAIFHTDRNSDHDGGVVSDGGAGRVPRGIQDGAEVGTQDKPSERGA